MLMGHPIHLLLHEIHLLLHLCVSLMYLESLLDFFLHPEAVLLKLRNVLILAILRVSALLNLLFKLVLKMCNLILMTLPHVLNFLLQSLNQFSLSFIVGLIVLLLLRLFV